MKRIGFLKLNYIIRGEIYEKLKKFELAENDYKKIISFDENDAQGYLFLTESYINVEKYDLALKMVSIIFDKNIKHNHKYYLRGLVYEKTNKYDLALNDYNKVIKLVPNHKKAREAIKRLKQE